MEKQTPLFSRHIELGAKMVPFAGFSMPVQYSGIKSEHLAVRHQAGLFDVSHMGNVLITGKNALDFLQKITVNNVGNLADLDVQYSAMCYENGGVVDDILLSKIEEDAYHMVINASNIEKDLAWMEKHRQGDVQLKNQSEELCILALQGPKAQQIAQKICSQDLSQLKPFTCGVQEVDGVPMVYSRTGYTGEDGFEFYPKNAQALSLWNKLLEVGEPDGLLPVGLGARDTLRLEAGYTLYGHEVNETRNLVEGGLSWIVDWNKSDFIGKEALLACKNSGPAQKIMGLELMEKGIPREGYPVTLGGEVIGTVTSGSISPASEKPLALAFLKASSVSMGSEVQVLIREKPKSAKIVSRYFYKRPKD